MKSLLKNLIRYGLAGGISTLALFGSLFFMKEFLGIYYLTASTIAFTITIIVSFFVQKYWAFQDNSHKRLQKQILLFLMLTLFNFVANISLMYILVDILVLWYILAQVLTIGLITFWSFLFYHFYLFNIKEDNEK